mmetsp:Transcript_86953/g.246477  ORF Transcript_86953/g.246477 Transcript_86953/m.246477 type:complete len:146 (-) Transcript_86953:1062-1499(-)
MDLLKWFVSSLEVIPRVKYLSLGPLVDEFRALLTEQLDMNTEALNLKKLREDFQGHKHVFFPEPFYSTSDILIEQFIDGIPIRTFMTRDTKVGSWVTRGNLPTAGPPRLLLRFLCFFSFSPQRTPTPPARNCARRNIRRRRRTSA